jgi:quinoprotein glucose dehydrogenase
LGLLLAIGGCGEPAPIDYSGSTAEWTAYGGDGGGSRYSPLTQIAKHNVGDLEIAWEYHTGDVDDGAETLMGTAFQNTPILVGDTLYVCTPRNRVIALDPNTGEERWIFDSHVDTGGMYIVTCRGVSHWRDVQLADGQPCREKIYMGTLDARMIAIDAKTGKLCTEFADAGSIDLSDGIGDRQPGEYGVTSPPALINGMLITGTMVLDNIRVDAPGGVIRGYDAHSGELRWSWDPLPPGTSYIETEDETGTLVRYRRGTTNAWSILSVDPSLNLVFVPTGNTSPDYYGGSRDGLDYYSSSVVALDAGSGEVRWHFQTVHHDVWDYDVPSQPVLFDFPRDGKLIPALAQATKLGHIFYLNRKTGEPLFPVEERKVSVSGVASEVLSPTQPVPTLPPPLHPHSLTPDDAWGLTPWDRGKCREKIAALSFSGPFTPPTTAGWLQYPSYFGGTNWGSLAVDPGRELMIVNTSRVAAELILVPRKEADAELAQSELTRGGPANEQQAGTPYAVRRDFLLSPLGIPCSPPPWGTLVGIDYATGNVRWEVALGTTEDLAPVPIGLTLGTPNQGGPIATAGGLVFIAATMDDYLRAFDSETGEELWKGRLPAGGQATPMTYRTGETDKQFVVIAAGGHAMMRTTLGDSVVAFALPSGD